MNYADIEKFVTGEYLAIINLLILQFICFTTCTHASEKFSK